MTESFSTQLDVVGQFSAQLSLRTYPHGVELVLSGLATEDYLFTRFHLPYSEAKRFAETLLSLCEQATHPPPLDTPP